MEIKDERRGEKTLCKTSKRNPWKTRNYKNIIQKIYRQTKESSNVMAAPNATSVFE